MRGKIVSIFLIISIGIFTLGYPVNAQTTDSIKLYEYIEGIDIAKSTGKPIVLSIITDSIDFQKNFPKTNAEANKFINIDLGRSRGQNNWVFDYFILFSPMIQKNLTEVMILDSEGREIVRTKKYDGQSSTDLTRVDSDNKIIGELKVQYSSSTSLEDADTFYSDTFKYAEGKKGKVQRLPQDKGLVSIKNLESDSSNYDVNFVTISGFIHNIKSQSSFDLDDGTGVLNNLNYLGGFGDIKEGDKIFVKIIVTYPPRVIAVSKNQIPMSSNSAKSDGAESSTKTPGFEVIIGVAALFVAWRKIMVK